jgi:hypothetical protein
MCTALPLIVSKHDHVHVGVWQSCWSLAKFVMTVDGAHIRDTK